MAANYLIPLWAEAVVETDAQYVYEAMRQLEFTCEFQDLPVTAQNMVLSLARQLKNWSGWGKSF